MLSQAWSRLYLRDRDGNEARVSDTLSHTPLDYTDIEFRSISSDAFLLTRISALEEQLHALSKQSSQQELLGENTYGQNGAGLPGIESSHDAGLYLTPSTSSVFSNNLPSSVHEASSSPGINHVDSQADTTSNGDEDALQECDERQVADRHDCFGPELEAVDVRPGPQFIYDTRSLDRTNPARILPMVERFLRLVCPLFPIICDRVLWDTASSVAAKGFKNDLPTCMTSLVMLLAQAYSPSSIAIEDLNTFSETVQRFTSLPVQLTLEYAQTQVLCSLFLLKRHQLLDSWHWLHSGCTTLYAMTRW